MLDIKWIAQNPKRMKVELEKRGYTNTAAAELLDQILFKHSENNKLINEIQDLETQKNQVSEQVKFCKDREQKNQLISDSKDLQNKIDQLKQDQHDNFAPKLREILVSLPNILQDDVPIGKDEADNVEVKRFDIQQRSTQRVQNNTNVSEDNAYSGLESSTATHIINSKNAPLKDHDDILKSFGLMDTEKTAHMSGTRFVTLKAAAAKLERALASMMLDINISRGFQEISPPYLVHDNAMYNAGQLPKFEADSFCTTNGYRLIPTSEVSLVNMFAGEIIDMGKFPIRMTAHTPCFRSEAGSAGRDTKGLLRLHQFSKVELVTICTPETAEMEHQWILETAEVILQALELPYRVMLLCSGDTSAHSSKTYDIEVWIPSQDKYREISSCSNCTDYQSRRLMTRYKNHQRHNTLVHTLNGSSLPIGRTIAAIVENYMDYDSNYVRIPKALVPYFGSETLE